MKEIRNPLTVNAINRVIEKGIALKQGLIKYFLLYSSLSLNDINKMEGEYLELEDTFQSYLELLPLSFQKKWNSIKYDFVNWSVKQVDSKPCIVISAGNLPNSITEQCYYVITEELYEALSQFKIYKAKEYNTIDRKLKDVGKIVDILIPSLTKMIASPKTDFDSPSNLRASEKDSPELTNSGQTIKCSKDEYTFTKDQVPIVKIFWENFLNGNEYLDEQTVLEEVDRPSTSLRDAFKSREQHFKALFERKPDSKNLWRLKLDS